MIYRLAISLLFNLAGFFSYYFTDKYDCSCAPAPASSIEYLTRCVQIEWSLITTIGNVRTYYRTVKGMNTHTYICMYVDMYVVGPLIAYAPIVIYPIGRVIA